MKYFLIPSQALRDHLLLLIFFQIEPQTLTSFKAYAAPHFTQQRFHFQYLQLLLVVLVQFRSLPTWVVLMTSHYSDLLIEVHVRVTIVSRYIPALTDKSTRDILILVISTHHSTLGSTTSLSLMHCSPKPCFLHSFGTLLGSATVHTYRSCFTLGNMLNSESLLAVSRQMDYTQEHAQPATCYFLLLEEFLPSLVLENHHHLAISPL